MASKTPLTDHEKGMIEAWTWEGVANREIARRLGVSEFAIRHNLRKLQEGGSMNAQPKSGHPRATTERDDRHLVRSSRRNRFKTAPELAVELADHAGVQVSHRTLSHRLA